MSGHYGVIIRDYLPTGSTFLSGATSGYVDHDITYGDTGDVCTQQFLQSTGIYYDLIDNFVQAGFGVNLYILLQNIPALGFTGTEADVGSFFYNEICVNNKGFDNLQDCLNDI